MCQGNQGISSTIGRSHFARTTSADDCASDIALDDSRMTPADDLDFGACAIFANKHLSDCQLDSLDGPFSASVGRETGMAATGPFIFMLFLLLIQISNTESS